MEISDITPFRPSRPLRIWSWSAWFATTPARSSPRSLAGIPVVDDVDKLPVKPQVALLCLPTRSVEENAKQYLAKGINTVDSFDIHTQIWELHCALDKAAKVTGAVSVISAGWDPGSDSVVRTLLEACAPKGITDTNFGPGMSMGHSGCRQGQAGRQGRAVDDHSAGNRASTEETSTSSWRRAMTLSRSNAPSWRTTTSATTKPTSLPFLRWTR